METAIIRTKRSLNFAAMGTSMGREHIVRKINLLQKGKRKIQPQGWSCFNKVNSVFS